MATLNYYTFSKRHKSTKQPTGGSQTDVQLKDGTSLISPVFLLNWSGIPSFNYVGFEGRYYFVKDIRSIRNNLWEVECEEDYLASHKTAIGNTAAMILYATGGRNDIIDQRLAVEANGTVDMNAVIATGDFTGFTSSTEGIAIISVTGTGSFGNYLVSAVDVPDLLRDVSIWDLSGITDAATGFQQLIRGGSAADNLRSAIYLPIILSSTSNFDAATQIYLGEYPCTKAGGGALTGMRVNNPFLYAHAYIDIPWKYSDWRRNTPYSKVFLYLPMFGCVNLTATDIVNETGLDVVYSLNMLGGDLAFQVRGNNSSRILATGSCNIAMQTPFGSANISGAKVASAVGVGASAIAAVAAGVVTGGAAVVALGGGLAASAGGLINALGGETAGGGGLTGSASSGLDLGIKCAVMSHDLADSQASVNPIIGKPVMKKATISSYSGFVQTDGMQIDASILDTERDNINQLCDGGFYYE